MFLPTGTGSDSQRRPAQPEPNHARRSHHSAPWIRNSRNQLPVRGRALIVYVHGHDTASTRPDPTDSPRTGYPPPSWPIRTAGSRASTPHDGAERSCSSRRTTSTQKSDVCDHERDARRVLRWDGGQLATDEVLDFVTNAPANLGNTAGLRDALCAARLGQCDGRLRHVVAAQLQLPVLRQRRRRDGDERGRQSPFGPGSPPRRLR